MDAVTFYALYAVGSGAPQAYNSLRFPSMEACQVFAERVIERKPPNYAMLDHACVAQGLKPPSWAPDGRIVGVPLSPDAVKR
jgi:hypothetical protein